LAKVVSGQVTLSCTTEDLPIFFMKAGSVIPWQSGEPNTRGKDVTHLTFTVYPMEQGSFSYRFLVDDGVNWLTEDNHEIIEFQVDCDKDEVWIKHNSNVPLTIVLADGWGRKLHVSV
jgi:alpha-glucosidase (family GH31 glycosyl hydrolase)